MMKGETDTPEAARMPDWSGFDQRKVCPQCGDYQTHLGIYERRKDSQDKCSLWTLLIVAFIITLLLIIFSISIAATKGASLKSSQFISLFFRLFLIIGLGASQILTLYLNSRQRKGLADEPLRPGERPAVYQLTCWNCGHEWEKTIDEWEQEGKTELQN